MDDAFLDDFRRTITDAAERLLLCSDADASRPLAPGKWSKKEVIGHLIDSAANNHARFVRAQLQDDLVFDDYDQARWVEVQRYRERPWADLVRLWHAYNLHIASVMESADAAVVARPPLDYLMPDYVAHLKHHLRQIFPTTASFGRH